MISEDIGNSLASIAEAGFIGDGTNSILTGHTKQFYAVVGKVGVRSLGGVLFWQGCILRTHSFANNSNRSHLEVMLDPTIFAKDPFMRLKRKRLGPAIDLKEVRRERVVAQAMEAEEGERPCSLARKDEKRQLLHGRRSWLLRAPRPL